MPIIRRSKAIIDKIGLKGLVVMACYLVSRSPVKINWPDLLMPIWIRPRTTDLLVFVEVFSEGEYDFPIDASVKVIVDVGANCGMAACYFSEQYPDAIIYSIEPDRDNYSALCRNIASRPNVKTSNSAIWSDDGFVDIINRGGGHGHYQVKNTESAKIPAETMDSFFIRNGIGIVDLLKIDVEGAEREIFTGSIEWLDNIKNIIIEFHEHISPGCSESFKNSIAHRPHQLVMKDNVAYVKFLD